MAKKYASTQRELFALISQDYGLINRNAPKKTLKESDRKIQDRKILSLVEELKKDIISGLNAYFNSYTPTVYENRPNGLRNNPSSIFESIEYDTESQTVHIRFAGIAWAPNAVSRDRHESFIPVLLNYGWNVKGGKISRGQVNSIYPSFNYYAGNDFISEAIEKFNLRCANENRHIQAKFMINGIDAETLYNNGGIPYRR